VTSSNSHQRRLINGDAERTLPAIAMYACFGRELP